MNYYRTTSYVSDGLRRYPGRGNSFYHVDHNAHGNRPVSKDAKVELTSDVQKTMNQAKEELKKPGVKRKKSTGDKNSKKRKKRSYRKKEPSGKQRRSVFSNGSR